MLSPSSRNIKSFFKKINTVQGIIKYPSAAEFPSSPTGDPPQPLQMAPDAHDDVILRVRVPYN